MTEDKKTQLPPLELEDSLVEHATSARRRNADPASGEPTSQDEPDAPTDGKTSREQDRDTPAEQDAPKQDKPVRTPPRSIPGVVHHGSPYDAPSPPPPLPKAAGSDFAGPAFDFIPPPQADRHPPFALDMGTEHFLFENGQGRSITSYRDCNEFLHVFADSSDAPCGVLEFQGTIKFAKVLARKQLEEKGELSTDMELLTYAARKEDNHVIRLVYQCPPRSMHEAIRARCTAHDKGAVVYDPMSVALCCLDSSRTGKASACIVRSARSMLLVMGARDKVILVRNFALLEGRADALKDALLSIERDLDYQAHSTGDAVDSVSWIDFFVPEDLSGLPETSLNIERSPNGLLLAEGRRYVSSLPNMINRLPLSQAVMFAEEARFRPLEKMEPALWALLSLILLFFGYQTWTGMNARSALQEDIQTLQSRIMGLRASMPELSGDMEDQARPYIDLAANLLTAAEGPTVGQLWNRISSVKPDPVLVDDLYLAYDDFVPTLELSGRISADMARSQTAYKEFLIGLERQDFVVLEQHMALEPAGNTFFLRLASPGLELLQHAGRSVRDSAPQPVSEQSDEGEE